MAVYAIADLHLSFGTDKPMDVFGGWQNYTERIRQNWQRLITDDDSGRKIIMKGNHDYWWTTKSKMDKYLHEKGFDTMSILHNNYYVCGGTALCGSRGWFYDAETDADMLILKREVGRLRMSIEPAVRDGYDPVVFLHYPPVYNNMECSEILDVLREYNIKKCFYGHIHGGNAAKRAFICEQYGISFRLIACDFLGFMPLAIN